MVDKERGPTGFSASDFAGVGSQFAGAILVFLFLGRWIDSRLGTAPIFLIAGTFIGAAGGFYSMWRKVSAATRTPDKPGKPDSRGADDR